MTKEQIQQANDDMYNHLDIFGWARPAKYYLRTQTIDEHALNGDKEQKQIVNGDHTAGNILDRGSSNSHHHLGII